ncbi:MAG: phosphoribosyltransferase [Synechococcales bacterium]|nr:phosphoribosyltransferase [Synechococcales bacterium]
MEALQQFHLQRFHDRTEAGTKLAQQLLTYQQDPLGLVLGLPRGGVPIASIIAQTLQLPLDICLVRKLGLPGNPEVAMGAIASGGVLWLNRALITRLGISQETIATVTARERQELQRRERVYRGDRPPLSVAGRHVILVDDGVATGATMLAAIQSLVSPAQDPRSLANSARSPARLVVAVPVAPQETYDTIASQVDQIVCVLIPPNFHAIGLWYDNFEQIADAEVCRLLQD